MRVPFESQTHESMQGKVCSNWQGRQCKILVEGERLC